MRHPTAVAVEMGRYTMSRSLNMGASLMYLKYLKKN